MHEVDMLKCTYVYRLYNTYDVSNNRPSGNNLFRRSLSLEKPRRVYYGKVPTSMRKVDHMIY